MRVESGASCRGFLTFGRAWDVCGTKLDVIRPISVQRIRPRIHGIRVWASVGRAW